MTPQPVTHILKAGNSTLALDATGRLNFRLNGQHQWQANAHWIVRPNRQEDL